MKKLKALFIMMVVCTSLFISVHGSIIIEQPGPRPTGICPIEKIVVKP